MSDVEITVTNDESDYFDDVDAWVHFEMHYGGMGRVFGVTVDDHGHIVVDVQAPCLRSVN